MTRKKIEIGDYITFQAATRWSGAKVKRKVVSFDHVGRPCVRYGGWSDFVVHPNEIKKVEKDASRKT